jgi:L-ascorbate metabolism protein UlaG (beta-lactamase superfamily)
MGSGRFVSALAGCALVTATAIAGCSSSSSTAAPDATTSATKSAAASQVVAASGVKIIYDETAQVEIVAPSGNRVIVDVWDPTLLSVAPTANDILLTTHGHQDHYVEEFVNSFPGQKITIEVKSIKTDDFGITTVASSHQANEEMVDQGGSNYIFIVEVGGLRIGHFGDIGQTALTDEQLTKIGKLDVMVSQLSNTFSNMNGDNRKGLNLANQVKPLIFIPTHSGNETATLAMKEWKGVYSTKPVTLTRETLPTETTMLFIGTQAADNGNAFNLKPATW